MQLVNDGVHVLACCDIDDELVGINAHLSFETV